MELSTWLVILKFIGIALSAGFGVLALLTEYKDKERKITYWGRIALTGVVLSAIITATAQSIELVLKEAQAEDNQKRALAQLKTNEKLLTNINRGLNPLTDVRASFSLDVDLEQPELQTFVQRFTRQISPLIAKWETEPNPRSVDHAYPSIQEINGKILEVSVRQDSALFPNLETERFAYTVFEHSTITMHFYAKPIPVDEFLHYGEVTERTKLPDITMSFEQDDDSPWDINLEFEPETKKFRVSGNGIKSDERYWDSTGKIISLLDLANAQVFITTGHSLVSFEEPEKRVHPSVHTIVLDIGARQGLWFREAQLKKHKDPVDGKTIYEYRFPATIEDIAAALN